MSHWVALRNPLSDFSFQLSAFQLLPNCGFGWLWAALLHTEHPISVLRAGNACSLFDVACWMFRSYTHRIPSTPRFRSATLIQLAPSAAASDRSGSFYSTLADLRDNHSSVMSRAFTLFVEGLLALVLHGACGQSEFRRAACAVPSQFRTLRITGGKAL